MARFWWAALCVTVSAIVIFLFIHTASKKRTTLALSTVKVLVGEGHGSAVHVGNRYLVSAAHVVGQEQTVKIKTSRGEEVTADVLWINKAHDLALLRAHTLPGVNVSRIDCAAVEVGQHIEAVGNPGPLEFITAFGRVSSGVEKRGPWAQAYIVSMTVAGGMSGGPAFDAQGKVVGIIVGVALTQIGFMPSALAFAYVVPSRAVCSMLARNA